MTVPPSPTAAAASLSAPADAAIAAAFREFASDYLVKHSRANAFCERIVARAAELRGATGQPEAQGSMILPPDTGPFADWLAREMPPGTVISDPGWWAPRILRQIAMLAGAPGAATPPCMLASGEAEETKRLADPVYRGAQVARVLDWLNVAHADELMAGNTWSYHGKAAALIRYLATASAQAGAPVR